MVYHWGNVILETNPGKERVPSGQYVDSPMSKVAEGGELIQSLNNTAGQVLLNL